MHIFCVHCIILNLKEKSVDWFINKIERDDQQNYIIVLESIRYVVSLHSFKNKVWQTDMKLSLL